jgi:hypothetical protein
MGKAELIEEYEALTRELYSIRAEMSIKEFRLSQIERTIYNLDNPGNNGLRYL